VNCYYTIYQNKNLFYSRIILQVGLVYEVMNEENKKKKKNKKKKNKKKKKKKKN